MLAALQDSEMPQAFDVEDEGKGLWRRVERGRQRGAGGFGVEEVLVIDNDAEDILNVGSTAEGDSLSLAELRGVLNSWRVEREGGKEKEGDKEKKQKKKGSRGKSAAKGVADRGIGWVKGTGFGECVVVLLFLYTVSGSFFETEDGIWPTDLGAQRDWGTACM